MIRVQVKVKLYGRLIDEFADVVDLDRRREETIEEQTRQRIAKEIEVEIEEDQ